MSGIPHIALFKKHKTRIIVGALVFWMLLGLLVYITEVIASAYFGAKFMDDIEQGQYLLRWIVWLIFTPVIILLGLKINIGNCKLYWFIILHLILGTIILMLEFCIEFAVLRPIAEVYYNRPVLIDELIIPFLSKYFGYIINYFLIIGIVNMYVYMQSLNSTRNELMHTELQNRELKYQLALAQIQTLKMQIQPHFLFNTHQSIVGLILNHENEKAVMILNKLSELLRISIENQAYEFVSLHNELVTIDLYLDLQKIRFGERLIYSKNVSDTALKMKVPFFILQPVVENAVKYGVERSDDAVTIQMIAGVDDHQLIIEILNSGVSGNRQIHQGLGIGLKNVTERLSQYYGDKASLKIASDDQNTIVTLTLPAHEA